MNHAKSILAVFLAAACAGCGDRAAPPPRDVNVATASEALRADQKEIAQRFDEQKSAADANFQLERARADRQLNVDALSAIAQRLGAAVRDAGATGRGEFPALIKRVEAIRAEANAVTVDDCTGKVRASLLEAITITVDAFNSFARETGAASEASTQKLAQAVELVDTIGLDLRACRSP